VRNSRDTEMLAPEELELKNEEDPRQVYLGAEVASSVECEVQEYE